VKSCTIQLRGVKLTKPLNLFSLLYYLHQFLRPTGFDYCAFVGASGRTAATPSGLMLKAKKVKGSPPGFPH
jgi:hypothetical protein